MKLFGMTVPSLKKAMQQVSTANTGWVRILESFQGAFQTNVTVDRSAVLSNHADFACKTLIASDIAKLRVKLVAKDDNGIWTETANSAFSPVLRKPNDFQTRIQFFESWVISKLQNGNAVILKQRDARKVVTALYVLDWNLVRVLVSDSGEVFYELRADRLSGVNEPVTVPAREIIHDRFNCLFHPLIGVSPIFAGGLAATHGLAIQQAATKFFQNGAQPGGILTAPDHIGDDTAARLKAAWEEKFSGDNAGRIAVLGDGLKYEQMSVNADNAQLIEQLKWTAEVVCSTYHVPGYKVGVGAMPTAGNVQSLNLEYYTQALQRLIEDIELLLDEGLGIGEGVTINGQTFGTEFDVDNLLRMDSNSLVTSLKDAVGAGVMAPNEARKKLNLGPTTGGAGPYLQQQNYSLEALAKRDAQDDPFGKSAPAAPAAPVANDNADAAQRAMMLYELRKGLADA